MKKFKEFRCIIEMSIMTGLLIIVSFYLGIKGEYRTMILGFIVASIASFGISMSYNIELKEDELSYYKWYFIIMVPSKIAYREIKSIRAISKHKIEINLINGNKSIYTYVFNCDDFMIEVNKARHRKRDLKRARKKR